MAKARCWDCLSENLIICPDPAMQEMTDRIVCLDCWEIQDSEALTWEQVDAIPEIKVGAFASTVIYSIGDRSSIANGIVTKLVYSRRFPERLVSVYLETQTHGTVVVEIRKLTVPV